MDAHGDPLAAPSPVSRLASARERHCPIRPIVAPGAPRTKTDLASRLSHHAGTQDAASQKDVGQRHLKAVAEFPS